MVHLEPGEQTLTGLSTSEFFGQSQNSIAENLKKVETASFCRNVLRSLVVIAPFTQHLPLNSGD